jgi:hypothetical protein
MSIVISTGSDSRYSTELQQAIQNYNSNCNAFSGAKVNFDDAIQNGIRESDIAKAINLTVEAFLSVADPDMEAPVNELNIRTGKNYKLSLAHLGVMGSLAIYEDNGDLCMQAVTNLTSAECPKKEVIKGRLASKIRELSDALGESSPFIQDEKNQDGSISFSPIGVIDQFEFYIKKFSKDENQEAQLLEEYSNPKSGQKAGKFIDSLTSIFVGNGHNQNSIQAYVWSNNPVYIGFNPATVPDCLVQEVLEVHKQLIAPSNLNIPQLIEVVGRTGLVYKNREEYDTFRQGSKHQFGSPDFAYSAIQYFFEKGILKKPS